jgi:hypothetical protein
MLYRLWAQEGGRHMLAGEGVGGPSSDDWTETLVLLYSIIPFRLPLTLRGAGRGWARKETTGKRFPLDYPTSQVLY